MNSELTLRLTLAPAAVASLTREIHGKGGFQNLLRRLQKQLKGNELTLTTDLVEKIARYTEQYGRGGFQGRLDTVLVQLQRLATVLRPMAA